MCCDFLEKLSIKNSTELENFSKFRSFFDNMNRNDLVLYRKGDEDELTMAVGSIS